MKKAIWIILGIVVIGAAAYYFFLRQTDQSPQMVNAAPTQSEVVSAAASWNDTDEVEAIGRLIPWQYREIHFRATGIIHEILVEEGQEVQAGDVLARLTDEQQLELAVSQAKLEVLNAEKALSDLSINAPLQAAQAYYEMAQTEQQIEKLKKKRTAMNYPRATEEEIKDAYDEYKQAEDTLSDVAQFFNADDDAYKAAKAKRDLELNEYNYLISKYTDLDKWETESELLLSERKLADLERRYTIYSQGPDPAEVAIAEARLQVAKDQLATAEANYRDLEVRAPFAGTIAQLDFQEGQTISPAQSLLMLADISRWKVATEDLTELSVTRIQPGALVEVRVDALPNDVFQGKVIEIKKIGQTTRGDITYTVVVELAENDPRLRWNMTSPITITTE